jgi:hypothetical protein
LTGPARWTAGPAAGTRRSRGRQAWANSERTWSGRRLPRGMHGTALARTQWWARRTGRLRTRALKNWLTRHRSSRRGTHRGTRSSGAGLRRGRSRFQRSLVHRSRSRLRNNHPRRGCSRSCRGNRARPSYGRRGSACNGTHTRCSRLRRSRTLWRRRELGRCRWTRGQNGLRNRRNRSQGRNRLCGHRSRSRLRRRYNWRLCGSGRRWNCGGRALHRSRRFNGRRNRFLLLRNCLKHISGAGDVRKVDLGLDFFFAAGWSCRFRGRWLRLCGSAEVAPHFFRFVLFQRTGVRLLLRHSD